MPYPPRPQLQPLGECVGANLSRPNAAVQGRVEAFVQPGTTQAGRCERLLS